MADAKVSVEKIKQATDSFRLENALFESMEQQASAYEKQEFEENTLESIKLLEKMGVRNILQEIADKEIVTYKEKNSLQKITYRLMHPGETKVPPIKAKIFEYTPTYEKQEISLYPYIALQFNSRKVPSGVGGVASRHHDEVRILSDGKNLMIGMPNFIDRTNMMYEDSVLPIHSNEDIVQFGVVPYPIENSHKSLENAIIEALKDPIDIDELI